jgi:hypothetical protein
VAPDPYEFCNLEIKSLIGEKADDHFHLKDKPVHQIVVTNRNGPECRVFVEIHAKTPCVSIKGSKIWRSEEMTHGGLSSRGKIRWEYETPLELIKVGAAQMLRVKIYMCGRYEKGEPSLIGEFDHAIWIT